MTAPAPRDIKSVEFFEYVNAGNPHGRVQYASVEKFTLSEVDKGVIVTGRPVGTHPAGEPALVPWANLKGVYYYDAAAAARKAEQAKKGAA